MQQSDIKATLGLLFAEWTWRKLEGRRGIERLIYTNYGIYRKDNAVVQNVGKPAIKFRFDIGSYLGGTTTTVPTHFSISTTGLKNRIKWMAMPSGDLFIQQRKDRAWQPRMRMNDFFDDPQYIEDSEIDLLEILMPGVVQELTQLLAGLRGVDQALEERFYGHKFG